MNWTVIWHPDAESQLADAWVSAPDQRAVTRAANALERALTADPQAAGESRGNLDHIAFDAPLRIFYRVDVAARVVHVVSVGTFRQGGRG